MFRRLALRRFLPIQRPYLRLFSTFNEKEFKEKISAAGVLVNQQKFEDALAKFQELKAESAQHLGEHNKYSAALHTNVANLYFKLQKFEESAKIWKQRCDYYEPLVQQADFSKMSEEEKLTMAYPWIPYGLTLFNLHRVDEAIEVTKKGIYWMEKAFGQNHNRTLEEYLRFGNILQSNKRLDLCVEYLTKYVEKKEFIIGPRDQKVLSVKLMIGSILSDLQRLEEGIQLYIQVLEACKENEETHLNVIFTTKLLLATAYKHLRRKKESLTLFEELNVKLDKVLQNNHINYIKVKCLYGLGLYDEGRLDQAFKPLKEGVQLSLQHNFHTTVEAIMARHYYALSLQNLGYQEEGTANMKEVNQTILKMYGPDSQLYIKNSIDLSNALIRAQKFDQGEEKLKMLKESLEKRGLRETSDYCKMMLNWCALYFTSGRPDEGKKVLQEFKELVDGSQALSAEFGQVIEQMIKRIEEIENQ